MKRRGTRRTARNATPGDRRLLGTRARVPEADPIGTRRQVAAVTGVLTLLAAVAAAPHAWDFAKRASREAPFLLADVRVTGLDRLDPDAIGAALDLQPGTPLVDLDVAAAEARLVAHPWVARATVVRVPPAELRVRVREQIALAVVDAGDPAGPWAVNRSGVAFAPASAQDVARLVHVALPEAAPRGEADPRLVEALALAASLRERGLEVPREVRLGLPERARSAQLRLRGFGPAIWIERDRHARQLDRLATLLASNLPAAHDSQLIDLRFAGRAVLWGGESAKVE